MVSPRVFDSRLINSFALQAKFVYNQPIMAVHFIMGRMFSTCLYLFWLQLMCLEQEPLMGLDNYSQDLALSPLGRSYKP